MASYVNSVGIAAEARRVFVDPRNAATYLRRHHGKIATCLLYRNKGEGDVVCPGIDKHLSWVAVLLGRAYQPVPAMDEDEDRRIGGAAAIKIELFDLGWSVRRALRCDAGAHGLAVTRKTLRNLCDERLVGHLILLGIELHLVVIHEDQGTLVVWRRTNAALLSESRRRSHGQCRGEDCPPADVVFTFHRYSPEFSRVSLHCVAQRYRVARSLGRMQCLLLALNGH